MQEKQGGEPGSADISELLEMLAEVPEFRGAQGKEYVLSFILAVCIVARAAVKVFLLFRLGLEG